MKRTFVLFFAAATGYLSLSQEMLWMRAVSYMTGGEPAVFAHVLGFFLIGVALGALFGEKLCAGRFAAASNGSNAPVRFVGWMLILSALVYYLSIALTAELLTISTMLGMAAVYVVVAGISFLLGGVFPVLCHYGAQAGQDVGLGVSRLYVANIVGSTLGPLLTGFVLMEYLGTDQIVLAIGLATLVLGAAAFLFEPAERTATAHSEPDPHPSPLPEYRARGQSRWRLAWPALAAGGGVALLLLGHGSLYANLLEKLQFQTNYYRGFSYKHLTQNRSGIIAVVADESGHSDMLYGGGMYDGNFNVDPYWNSNGIDRAYMIAALHPDPQEVLEIGLASGSWSRVLAAYGPVKKHTIVEINPGYLPLIARYSPQKDLLSDPKVQIVIDDGRRWLKRHPENRFDFILQNTTWHWRSQITNLLSVEYLELCKSHLKPGGVMYYNTTHSEDVAYTAAHVFKYVVRYAHFVAASDAPFELTTDQVRENMGRFRMEELLDPGDPQPRKTLEEMASYPLKDWGSELRRRKDLQLITDDNMATEYKRQKLYRPERSWGSFLERRRGGTKKTGSTNEHE